MKKIYALLILLFCSTAVFSQAAWTNYNVSNSPIADNSVHSIALVNDSTAWIGTEGGLMYLSGSTWTSIPMQPGGLSWYDVRCIEIDQKTGTSWFGTFNGGVCSYHDTTWTTYRMSNSPIADDFIRSIAFDTAGVKWFGAGGGGGLSCLDTAGNWTIYTMANSILGSNNIATMYNDTATNMLYAGTVNGGMLTKQDTSFQNYTIQNSGIPDNTLLDMTKDNLGNLWIATPGNGLVVKLPAFGWFKYIPVNSSILSYGITAVAFDEPRNLLWAGSYDAGLIRKNGNSFTHFMSTNSPMDDYVQTIRVGHDGRIWVGTHGGGLFILNPDLLTGIESLANDNNLVVYPNPSSQGFVHFSSNKICRTATLYDFAGRALNSVAVNDLSHTLDVSMLTTGFYFLELQYSDGEKGNAKIFVRN